MQALLPNKIECRLFICSCRYSLSSLSLQGKHGAHKWANKHTDPRCREPFWTYHHFAHFKALWKRFKEKKNITIA